MRVIGGRLKGRKLAPLGGMRIRPTSDYLREAIFNILARELEGSVVLDLFAGTGSLGIEALSRGAERAVFVDHAAQAIKTLSRNLKTCDLEKRSRIFRRDISRGLGFVKPITQTFDLVFVDPPYNRGFAQRTLLLIDGASIISDAAVVVIEHSDREAVQEKMTRLTLDDQRHYGKTLVSFYRPVL